MGHLCFQSRAKGPITHMGPADSLPAPASCITSVSPPHSLVYFGGSFSSQVAPTTLPSSQTHSWFGMGCREGLTTDFLA